MSCEYSIHFWNEAFCWCTIDYVCFWVPRILVNQDDNILSRGKRTIEISGNCLPRSVSHLWRLQGFRWLSWSYMWFDKVGMFASSSFTGLSILGNHAYSRNDAFVFASTWWPLWARLIMFACRVDGMTTRVPRKSIPLAWSTAISSLILRNGLTRSVQQSPDSIALRTAFSFGSLLVCNLTTSSGIASCAAFTGINIYLHSQIQSHFV